MGLVLASVGALAFVFPNVLSAQAWLPPEGETSVELIYQNFYVRDHLVAHGEAFQVGTIRTNTILFGLTYGITDRFAVSASLPYVYSRYDGHSPHDPHFDNGDYHGVFADYRFDLRYNLVRNPAVITPFVAGIIPSHRYVTFAHAAPSVGLHEYLVGVNMGRRLDPILPEAFVQGRYSYAFVERVLGISHNRSNYDLELGYFVSSSLALSASAAYQRTHGGIDFPLLGTPAFIALVNSPLWPHHDVIARAEYLNVGGGVSYALTGSVDVSVSYMAMVWGKNIHKVKSGLIFGFSYNFSPQQAVRRFFPVRTPSSLASIE